MRETSKIPSVRREDNHNSPLRLSLIHISKSDKKRREPPMSARDHEKSGQKVPCVGPGHSAAPLDKRYNL